MRAPGYHFGVYGKLGFKKRSVTNYYEEPAERMVIFDLDIKQIHAKEGV